MKGILKTGRVAVFIIGDQYMVVGEADMTEREFVEAVEAEEELQKFREQAPFN